MGYVAVLAVTLSIIALQTGPAAAEVRFPLTVDYQTLRVALRKHLREAAGGELSWRSPDGCRSLVLREPVVEPADGRLKISGRALAHAAIPFLGLCWAQVSWTGRVEILARPEIGPDWQLRFRDLDTQLYTADRRPSAVASRIWDAVKGWAESELPAFSFDLGPPVEEVKGLLSLFAGAAQTGPLMTALQTVRPVGLAVDPDGVKLAVAIDLPPAVPTPQAPEPALTPAQLKQWQATLDRWDAFLVFVVKDLGLATSDPAMRNELLDLLLVARHDLLAVLGRGPEAGVDPVRQLFLRSWNPLRAIVRRTAAHRADESRALRYVIFLAAGDALAALETAATAAGLEISADGLRRLARTLDPAHAGDPLEYSETPDPQLQRLFRFRDPDAPPRRSRPRAPGSWNWFTPRRAYAAPAADEWSLLAKQLDRWVPSDGDVLAYLPVVDRVLTMAAERTLDPEELDPRFDDLFHHLVKAVAWQESCWRQFVRKGQGIIYLLSPTGDVGLMQVNPRIWRGFFDPEKLRWNAAYNAGAGAEILLHLLVRYGLQEATNRMENAARATYAAYNGGPARYRRYRLVRSPSVDAAFWEKYQLVAAGKAEDRVLCLAPRASPR